jgi:hypothetical protein
MWLVLYLTEIVTGYWCGGNKLNFGHISEDDGYFRGINIHSTNLFGREAKPG